MGLVPVFSVSPSPADRTVLDRILEIAPRETRTLGRVLSLPQLAAAISGGRAFVGVDTVVTHMAAALEVPTVAIFGPTWVHHWGPWPNGETSAAPYDAKGRVQRRGRIAVVQKDWPCVPCNQEWCCLSRGDSILCLENLSPEEVFEEFRLVVERGKSGETGGKGTTSW
jgi:heptosyltransferase-3